MRLISLPTAIRASLGIVGVDAIEHLTRTDVLLHFFVIILFSVIDTTVTFFAHLIGFLLTLFLEELILITLYLTSYGLIPLISYSYRFLVTMISPIDLRRWTPWDSDVSPGHDPAAANGFSEDKSLLILSDQLQFTTGKFIFYHSVLFLHWC